MLIKDWKIEENGDTKEISTLIDGFRLWYHLPKQYCTSKAGDSFLVAALFPAMSKGEVLEIDSHLAVSPRLLKNITNLQEIHHCWNPALDIIPIEARTLPSESINNGVLTFFSGGVDSSFTFLKHLNEISHAVLINGFDFFLDKENFMIPVKRNSQFMQTFNKILIPVETNYYEFGYNYNLSRVLTQTCILASIALLLAFPCVYIPASYSYSQLIPWGSHPLTDPLYSNEGVQIVHDGAEVGRVDKIKRIAESERIMNNLWVCLKYMDRNCGRCSKCLRTMIPLEILGVKKSSFPPSPSLREISRLDWKSDCIFFDEILRFAVQEKNEQLKKALLCSKKRYEWMELLKQADKVFMGGLIKHIYRKLTKRRNASRRITVVPDEN